jgi:ribosomal protein S18 acetylase RimI-like enzyme
MAHRKPIEQDAALFGLERLAEHTTFGNFSCSVQEYSDYLFTEAWRSQVDQMANTWLLIERANNNVVAYMSLIADAIKLSASEKDLHHLDYPFKTVPAMKIAKLAVSDQYKERYSGIGSLLIRMAKYIARKCNDDYFACRFITVDADIEHNETVMEFYTKNGFLLNDELYNKKRKTVSMRKDIIVND